MNPCERTDASGFRPTPRWVFASVDLLVTLLVWTYFTAGFVVFFAPFYLVCALLASDRQHAFQNLNHLFYRGFFLLCRLLMPLQTWRIDPAVSAVRSSVIVCNHISYMDSILLISLFARHTTIVKNRLLRIPIFGWMLGLSGYLPAVSEGPWSGMMLERLERMPGDLAAGGNLIVFPEGTRSRTGAIGPLNKGAFKIARLCRAPVVVLFIRNTNRLFTPGKFLFNTCQGNTVHVDLLARLEPDYDSESFSLEASMDEVRTLLIEHARQTGIA